MNRAADIRRYFAQRSTPIWYINTTPFNLLGADGWMGGLRHLNTVDCFDGGHARTYVPTGGGVPAAAGFEAANQYLLDHPAVHARLRPGDQALFLMMDARNEATAKALGLQVCLPSAALRTHLDSKVVTTALANAAGVASVPHVLAQVTDYASLRSVARALGPDLVVQLPYGDSGTTTFFISNAADFKRHAMQITAQPKVKVMRRIRCRPLTIEACVMPQGTLVGPLQTEMTGMSELTPFAGGWCGNEVFGSGDSAVLDAQVRLQAQQATQRMGDALRAVGYCGVFGLDFLRDEDSGQVYLGEMNPRITGASPLTSQALLDGGDAPLLLYHLLAWCGQASAVDVDAFNQQWLRAEGVAPWGQMIIEHTGLTDVVAESAPPTGLWRMQADGSARFEHAAHAPSAVADEDHALFLRTVNPGQRLGRGASLGRLVLRGRLMDDTHRLNARAQRWIAAMRASFSLCPLTAQPVPEPA